MIMDIEKLAYNHGANIYENGEVRFYTLNAFTKFAEAYHQAKCNKEIQALRAQLPVGMQHCTIVFKRCEHGHGTLTATNWVQHECETCLINSLRAKVASVEVLVEALREAKLALLSGVLPYESVRIIEKAIAKYEKLSEVKHD